MISVIVVDDEWYNLEEISDLVEKTEFMNVVGKYQNPLKVLETATIGSLQAAFIDIEMPEMDGITLAETLLEINPEMMIIFITSWNQYAVQAFDLNALDYIMKPIKMDRFKRMVEKIQNEVSLKVATKSKALTIKCFNRFEICMDDTPVKWERAKAEELFAFLLMHHKKFVHKEVIIENLWPNYEITKALPILQTSICKIRKVFSHYRDVVILEYSCNKYCLSSKNVECDFLEMDSLITKKSNNEDVINLAKLEKICSVYCKGFLSQQGYIWSMQKDEEIRQGLIQLLKKLALVYSEDADLGNLKKILSLLTGLATYEDEPLSQDNSNAEAILKKINDSY